MGRDSPNNRLERSPLHLLHRAGQCAAELFQLETAGETLTPRQYALLVVVANNEGLSQTQLVELTGIDRSTLADVVRRMMKKGLLQRRRTRDDARAYAVKLTELGVKTLKSHDPLARRVDERLLSTLSASDRDRFVKNLNAIVQATGRTKTKVDGKAKY
ncbi:MarR family transcriptional regulator [Hyphomicrobium methylovorum]|uniref:MarR family winged helix-turn-helix transcriptional regulator n=1 Tax=Hyphomicrobium methylovorum TaxID=84 RepID=UPI0015E6FD91|nr:MarR family transcriptional regulator [Hyphomicrobium methylovorum]MBA2126176.1 MarR family transcriptional regulator [Hyphomicrobium methylovorum]